MENARENLVSENFDNKIVQGSKNRALSYLPLLKEKTMVPSRIQDWSRALELQIRWHSMMYSTHEFP